MRIPGFKHWYDVDTEGVVTSHYRRLPRRLKWKIGTDGYPRVALVPEGGGQAKWVLVHRIVLLSFVGPPPPDHEGRHLDGNVLNPSLGNLMWSTHRENVRDKRKHGTDHNASKVRCINGHKFDEQNTYYRPDRPGNRQCRACNRDLARRKREAA